MVGDLGGVLEALRLHQHHLELGGGVDVHHLVVAPLHPLGALRTVGIEKARCILTGSLGPDLRPVQPAGAHDVEVLVILLFVLIGAGDPLEFIKKSHGWLLLK